MQKGLFMIIFAFFCFTFVTNFNIVQAYVGENEVQYRLDQQDDCNSILGDPTKDGTFANMLQQIFTIMGYMGPVLCLVLSVMDFLKAAASQEKENLMKAFKTTGKRIVLAMALFFLPMLINFLFPLLGWYGTCGIE